MMSDVVDAITGLPTEPPSLYIDLEGIDLSRKGSISILQLYAVPRNQVYVIDVLNLRNDCFSAPGTSGRTFREILESESIPKVFFDVRNDSDALFSHYQINLQGVQDVQLMEVATRDFSRRCVNGLSKCIERDAPLASHERIAWIQVKERGKKLFAPEKGGRYEVFNERPLPDEIMAYCAQDVRILPRLWARYNSKLTDAWREKIVAESNSRVKQSQSPNYNGKGRHMALAPSGW